MKKLNYILLKEVFDKFVSVENPNLQSEEVESIPNPIPELIKNEVWELLSKYKLINMKAVDKYIIQKEYKKLRSQKMRQSDILDIIKQKYPHLQPQTLRKISYKVYEESEDGMLSEAENDIVYNTPMETTDVTVYYDSDDDEYADAEGKFLVKWTADINHRRWGIDSISINVLGVSGKISMSNGQQIDLNTEASKDYKIDIEKDSVSLDNAIAPKTLEIDITRKIITIVF